MRKSEKIYMDKVAQLPCIICGVTPVELHHVREGQGMSQRASNFLVVALCPEHHRGGTGLHGLGTRGFYTRYKLEEIDLLAMTIELLWG